MIACDKDGTVVIVSSTIMVMRNSHQSGKKEEQYKKYCKSTAAVLRTSFRHEHRLAFADQIVKMTFVFPEWAF